MNTITTEHDLARAIGTIYLEARHLDEQRWDDWLALYAADATFWVPAWRGEHETTSDPHSEISFIHAGSRTILEERVRRIRSGKSITTLPLPRTVHMISNPVMLERADGRLVIGTVWVNHLYDPRTSRQWMLFGHYEHRFAVHEGELRIAAKTVRLANDLVPTVLDIYSV